MSREHIAKSLKRLREQSGLTANQVGDMVGKSGKTVNAWENNRGQPDAEMLMKLCDIYNVSNILAEFRAERSEDDMTLSNHEKNVIYAYRNKIEMQPAIDKILGLEEVKHYSPIEINKPNTVKAIIAADGGGVEVVDMPDDLPEIDDLLPDLGRYLDKK